MPASKKSSKKIHTQGQSSPPAQSFFYTLAWQETIRNRSSNLSKLMAHHTCSRCGKILNDRHKS